MYPIFLNIENKLAVVIGGGKVAFRKASNLLQSGAIVKIISPSFISDFNLLVLNYKEKLSLLEKEYEYGDLKDSILVFSATDKREVNLLVEKEAKQQKILLNSTDNPQSADFILPSIIKKGDLNIAISTSGASPAYSSRLKKEIETFLDCNIEEILILLKNIRIILIESVTFSNLTSPERGDILRKIANDNNLITKLLLISKEVELIDEIKNYLK